MSKHLILITAFLGMVFLHPLAGSAYEIAVVKSADIRPYNEALEGFESVCKVRYYEYVLDESSGPEIVRKIRRRGPDLVLAIGLSALSSVKTIKDKPIIYMMVSNPASVLSGERNITGVSMNVSARKQLGKLLEVLPGIKRVGIVYDPKNSRHLFKEARDAASSLGVSIVARKVESAKEVPSAIKDMKGNIDAFWMLPDTTVITLESMKYLFLFSFENRIPVLTFSGKFVEMGSLMSLGIDERDIGRQAGEMANRILRGTDVRNIPMSPPRKAVLSLNAKAVNHLGLKVDEKYLDMQYDPPGERQ